MNVEILSHVGTIATVRMNGKVHSGVKLTQSYFFGTPEWDACRNNQVNHAMREVDLKKFEKMVNKFGMTLVLGGRNGASLKKLK